MDDARARIVAAYKSLYKQGKVTKEQLKALVTAEIISQEEYELIIK